MQPARLPLRIRQGTTLNETLRLMQPTRVYKSITSIIAGAPVRVVVPGHGLAGTWPVWFSGVLGLPALNRDIASARPHRATVIDADTLEINAIDATDTRPSGGRLVYSPPVDLTGVRARLQVRASVEAPAVLLELSTDDGITIDGPGLVRRHLSAERTAAQRWSRGVYDLELTFPDGTVSRWIEGEALVVQEVTR